MIEFQCVIILYLLLTPLSCKKYLTFIVANIIEKQITCPQCTNVGRP